MKNIKHPFKEVDSHKIVSFGETIYMFGGFANENTLMSNLYKITSNFEGRQSDGHVVDVEEIEIANCPPPRYNHAMVGMSNCIWIFGGILGDGNKSNELWKFNIAENNWEIVVPSSGQDEFVP